MFHPPTMLPFYFPRIYGLLKVKHSSQEDLVLGSTNKRRQRAFDFLDLGDLIKYNLLQFHQFCLRILFVFIAEKSCILKPNIH